MDILLDSYVPSMGSCVMITLSFTLKNVNLLVAQTNHYAKALQAGLTGPSNPDPKQGRGKMEKDVKWASALITVRKRAHMTRRDIALAVDIDPSYITLMERDGNVPKREIVADIAKATGANEDKLMMAAGYLPEFCPYCEKRLMK